MTRPLWIALLMLFATTSVVAQVERVLPRKGGGSSLEGTEFLVGFMQNEIQESDTDPRLQIFICSQYDATVNIKFPGQPFTQIRRIAANTVHVETVLPIFEATASEYVQRKSISITSDVPIVVYALSTLATSTDSYTAIPVKHLGTQYLTVNMPADQYRMRNPLIPELDTTKRRAEFMIMAVEDRTDVTITPTVQTEQGRPANVPFQVQLDSGETYLVKAARTLVGYGDLSGSRINADKPIAVLSGHMRTSVPTDVNASKDHLVEMLPPMQTWGMEYVTTPFAMVEEGDVVRLMTADVDTHIEIITEDGLVDQFFTRAGEWRDVRLMKPAYYRSNKPFFVMQFMPSSRPFAGTNPNYDPAMVVVPPLDQYVERALFQFPILDSTPQIGSAQRFYYFINVVAEAKAIPSMRVNQLLVKDIAPEIETQQVPGTDLYWATVPLTPAVYTITADSGLFSGVMYGTSYADSYANLFGVAYEPLPQDDRSPPEYALDVSCGDIDGLVVDVSPDSALLTEVIVQTAQTFNYRWAISNPLDEFGKTQISAWVRDRWQDARFVVHAYDHKGNGREWLFEYDAPAISVPDRIVLEASTGDTICVPVSVVNVDSTARTISSISLWLPGHFSLKDTVAAGTVVAPGDSVVVTLCYVSDSTGLQRSARLIVDLGCGLTKEIELVGRTTTSIETADHDFGPVRLGDTVCVDLPIVNTGIAAISIDSIVKGAGQDYWYDVASVPLPRMLQPGDTIWVRVCYSPSGEGSTERTDTVATAPRLGATMWIRGRGVAPLVRQIFVDWGKRRVGLDYDTLSRLHNDGSGACRVTPGAPVVGEAAFDVTSITSRAAFGLAPGEGIDLPLRFSPSREGPFADTIPLVVDWALHPRVEVILLGQGMLPIAEPNDIDMGDVVIGQQRDSVVDYLRSIGSEDLEVFAIRHVGPDVTAFVVDPAVDAMQVLPMGSTVVGNLRFTPTRLGQHTMEIEVDHATVGNDTITSVIRIRGNGIDEPVRSWAAALRCPDTVDACVQDTFVVVVTNTGTLDITPVRVDIEIMSTLRSFTDQLGPLRPGAERTYTFTEISTRASISRDVRAVVWLDDGESITITKNVELRSSEPDFDLEISDPVANGGSVVVSFSAQRTDSLDVPENLEILLTAPADRWEPNVSPIPVRVTDRTGVNRVVMAAVTRIADRTMIVLSEPVQAPYDLRGELVGTPLWRDVNGIVLDGQVSATSCSDEVTDRLLLTVEACGGNLRSVLFDALPQVRVSIVGHPVGDQLDLLIESSHETEIQLHLLSATGEVAVLADKFPLQKGIHHCNFSTSDRASGFYGLIVRYGSGEQILPVVLVK